MEFLKIDFPRIPYPSDKTQFWKLVEFGRQIQEIHLLESPVVENYITQYPEDGDNLVDKPSNILQISRKPLVISISVVTNPLKNG